MATYNQTLTAGVNVGSSNAKVSSPVLTAGVNVSSDKIKASNFLLGAGVNVGGNTIETIAKQSTGSNYITLSENGDQVAQGFTVAADTLLSKLVVKYGSLDPVCRMYFSIQVGSPNGDDFLDSTFQYRVDVPNIGGLDTIHEIILDTPVLLTAGTTYYLRLTANDFERAGQLDVTYNTSDVYSGGNVFSSIGGGPFIDTGGDLFFELYGPEMVGVSDAKLIKRESVLDVNVNPNVLKFISLKEKTLALVLDSLGVVFGFVKEAGLAITGAKTKLINKALTVINLLTLSSAGRRIGAFVGAGLSLIGKKTRDIKKDLTYTKILQLPEILKAGYVVTDVWDVDYEVPVGTELLLVGLMRNPKPDDGAIRYNNIPLTFIDGFFSSLGGMAAYYLQNPPAGNYKLKLENSQVVTAYCIKNVDTSAIGSFGKTVSGWPESVDYMEHTLAVLQNKQSLIVDFFEATGGQGNLVGVAHPSQTVVWQLDARPRGTSYKYASGADSATMRWDKGVATSNWGGVNKCLVAVEVKPAEFVLPIGVTLGGDDQPKSIFGIINAGLSLAGSKLRQFGRALISGSMTIGGGDSGKRISAIAEARVAVTHEEVGDETLYAIAPSEGSSSYLGDDYQVWQNTEYNNVTKIQIRGQVTQAITLSIYGTDEFGLPDTGNLIRQEVISPLEPETDLRFRTYSFATPVAVETNKQYCFRVTGVSSGTWSYMLRESELGTNWGYVYYWDGSTWVMRRTLFTNFREVHDAKVYGVQITQVGNIDIIKSYGYFKGATMILSRDLSKFVSGTTGATFVLSAWHKLRYLVKTLKATISMSGGGANELLVIIEGAAFSLGTSDNKLIRKLARPTLILAMITTNFLHKYVLNATVTFGSASGKLIQMFGEISFNVDVLMMKREGKVLSPVINLGGNITKAIVKTAILLTVAMTKVIQKTFLALVEAAFGVAVARLSLWKKTKTGDTNSPKVTIK